MRVTLITFSLGRGGAQRVMTNMANYWASRGWDVNLLFYGDGHNPTGYRLHAAVRRWPLGIRRRSSNPVQAAAYNIRRLMVIRRVITDLKPDVVISFLDRVNIRTIIACFGIGCPVIVSERVDPARHSIGRLWGVLRSISYRFATRLVTQTEEALGYFPESVRRKGCVIPNPLAMADGLGPGPVSARERVVMGMGRLVHQKGFDLLIRAFALVSEKHLDWSLRIWGDGERRADLESLRDELELHDRVKFGGLTEDPFSELRRAGLFVLASRFEGFPNVLCEAMACGTAVVSFDCPSGPRRIIRDGLDGVLVPLGDVCAMAGVMDRLMASSAERASLGANAVSGVERFGINRIMDMWEDIVRQAIEGRSG